eukprot:3430859-Pyramimonas_sp.AAC.1
MIGSPDLQALLLVILRRLRVAIGGVPRGARGVREGIYRSSLDAHKPRNPINSEEYQGHLQ